VVVTAAAATGADRPAHQTTRCIPARRQGTKERRAWRPTVRKRLLRRRAT